MYVGCFVVINPGIDAYYVSSQPFPNQRVIDRDDTLIIGPTPDALETDDPYIAYGCVREGDDYAVVSNGSQVDPAAEKLDLDYLPHDALAEILLALDYEKDDYDAPRIAGIVGGDKAYIGITRKDALIVEAVTEPTPMTTYKEDDPYAFDLDAETAADAARELYGHGFEHIICTAAAIVGDAAETSFYNGE